MDNKIIDLLINLDNKIDKINEKINNLVTKKECEERCNNNLELEVKKKEWSFKKVSLIIGFLTVYGGSIVGFVKLLFPSK